MMMEDTQTRSALTAYLESGGKVGYQPDWYPVIKAAKYLGMAPWKLAPDDGDRGTWLERVYTAMQAEEGVRENVRAMYQERERKASAARHGAPPETRDELTKTARHNGGLIGGRQDASTISPD